MDLFLFKSKLTKLHINNFKTPNNTNCKKEIRAHVALQALVVMMCLVDLFVLLNTVHDNAPSPFLCFHL